jgi:hypothetical protein
MSTKGRDRVEQDYWPVEVLYVRVTHFHVVVGAAVTGKVAIVSR